MTGSHGQHLTIQYFLQDRCPFSYLTNSVTLKIIYKRTHNNCEKCEQYFFHLYTMQLAVRKFWSAFYPLTVRRSASPQVRILHVALLWRLTRVCGESIRVNTCLTVFFAQPLSKSLVHLLIWHPPHTPYISSPNHRPPLTTHPYQSNLSCCSTKSISSNPRVRVSKVLRVRVEG